MTVTIELPPDIAAGLLAQARAEGLDVANYVRNLIRKQITANAHAESEPAQAMQRKKRLSELFATLRCVDIDFSRNPSTGRPVNL